MAGAIEPSVRLAEIERARRKRPDSLDAYDLYLQAIPHAWAYTLADTEKAIELLEMALQIDPGYVAAHGLAAWCNGHFSALVPGQPRKSAAVQPGYAGSGDRFEIGAHQVEVVGRQLVIVQRAAANG